MCSRQGGTVYAAVISISSLLPSLSLCSCHQRNPCSCDRCRLRGDQPCSTPSWEHRCVWVLIKLRSHRVCWTSQLAITLLIHWRHVVSYLLTSLETSLTASVTTSATSANSSRAFAACPPTVCPSISLRGMRLYMISDLSF